MDMTRVIEALQWRRMELEKMDREYRRNLINSISGFKSANLIGSIDAEGQTNLAIFSSIVHIGANPPYMGFVVRPITVPRHTYNNIKETGYFTINSIHKDFFQQAHQTSANYPASLSEFEECGLTPAFGSEHPAPYVQESHIKIGLELQEELPVKCNGTIILIGEIIELQVAPNMVSADGFVKLDRTNVVTIAGLDGYYEPVLLDRMAYARPGIPPQSKP